ncbi:MAG TPA: DUF4010 domain-containing protein [Plasticicumulans sp.]|nr:DUF4010 domain-containing protein [Plasticicumulans sp.]
MSIESGDTFLRIGLSVALGLLIGLQREATGPEFAGLRSFALTALLGTLCGLLAERFGGWVLVAGLAAITTLLVLGNVMQWRGRVDDLEPSVTTELALLLMFGLGAYLAFGAWEVAVVVAGLSVVLLHFKVELHALARRLGGEDLRAIMQFVLITFIVLPVLPNRSFGPLEVFNPFEIWLMVTLIVGISLGGYLLYKAFGGGAGVLLGGLLGGAVSSTATTLAYARRVRDGLAAPLAAVAIALASAVMLVRVVLIVSLLAPALALALLPAAGAMLAATLVPVAWHWRRSRRQDNAMPAQKNPAELGPAMLIAALYALILFVLAAARRYLGHDALYLVSVVAGLTDVDAIVLSVTRFAAEGSLPEVLGWRLIVTAVLSNAIFKLTLAASLGGREVLLRTLALLAPSLVIGIGMVVAWPD